MGATNSKKTARIKRKHRIRKKITGSMERPRLSVFRSSKHIYAQIIDDTRGVTLASASSLEKEIRQAVPTLIVEGSKETRKMAMANYIGKIIGERALKQGIKKLVFDRNGFLYHGRVKAVSEGARKAGVDL